MSFFGGVRNVHFPEVVMNQGPLPQQGGLPAPLHDTADGRINYGSTLLGNLTPYAYGESGYISSDTAYINFPHRIQKIVPQLALPIGERGTKDLTEVSHPVDDSDVAFAMRLDRTSRTCMALQARSLDRARIGMTVDPYVNLATVNYILAGVQHCYDPNGTTQDAWTRLLHDMDRNRFPEHTKQLNFADLVYIVKNLLRPFGIVRGSEKQGGQDQVGTGPATWPVCFITTMVVDGKERNVHNAWMHHRVQAGDDLVFRLKLCPLPPEGKYTLNHYYKKIVKERITVPGIPHVWQLVPDVFSLDLERPSPYRPPEGFQPADDYVWQETGYWHIGRSQVMLSKYAMQEHYYDDMALAMKTAHLEMTFQPCWQRFRTPPPRVVVAAAARPAVLPPMLPGQGIQTRMPCAPRVPLERPVDLQALLQRGHTAAAPSLAAAAPDPPPLGAAPDLPAAEPPGAAPDPPPLGAAAAAAEPRKRKKAVLVDGAA